MKLRTSYFNGTVLRKDITRFAPVWVLYTVFLLLYVMLIHTDRSSAAFANNILNTMDVMAWINLLYAGLCATLLFGDLFHARMCNALHAMPMRREGWFFTHITAGLLFAVVPNLVGTLTAMVLLQEYFYAALIWLAASVLQYLFFFGAAVFACLCAGNRLAMAAISGLINFLAGIIYWLATVFYEPLLYGIRLKSEPFAFFMPVFHITGQAYVQFDCGKDGMQAFGGFVSESWHYLYGIAAVGLVFLALSLLFYRKRKLESAGDFISVRPVAPVFLVIYSLVASSLLYFLAEAFGADGLSYLFLGIGLVIGFFTGKMLLDRTLKVFRPKVILGFVLFAAVFAGSFVITWLDPLSIGWYIPKTEDIQSVSFYNEDHAYYYEDWNMEGASFTSAQEIDAVRSLHRQIMLEGENKQTPFCRVQISYLLKNGKTVKRYYSVPVDSAAGNAVRQRLSDPCYVVRANDWDSFVSSISMIEINSTYDDAGEYKYYALTDPAEINALIDAVKQDCQDGSMVQDWVYHNDGVVGWVTIEVPAPTGTPGIAGDSVFTTGRGIELTIYEDCTNTAALLSRYGQEA